MRKPLLALAVASAFALPTFAVADDKKEEASPHTFTGNLSLVSSYRFRGIDQTFGKPAIQGGIDYSHSSGIYLGNWDSNVSQGAGYPNGNLEMDFYGGWKKAWGDWGLDIGAIYYYYPGTSASATSVPTVTNNITGTNASGKVSNKELYIGGSWKWLSLKYSQAIDDYFSVPGTKNSHYLDLSGNYDLGNGWGVNGHLGSLKFKGMHNGDYTDVKLGVTKDVKGWVFGASYVGTDTHGSCSSTFFNDPYCFGDNNGTKFKDAGRSTVILSVTKTF